MCGDVFLKNITKMSIQMHNIQDKDKNLEECTKNI